MARGRTRARRRTGRRIAVAVAVLAVVVGGLYVGTALKRHGDVVSAQPAGAPSARTTLVRRTDLSDSRALPGTLGYGAARTIKGAGKGLITRLPEPGSTITRGKPLYWEDDQPVMLFYGGTPVFRTLDKAAVEAGASGTDVSVLADNLKALGYDVGPEPRGKRPATGTEKAPGTLLTSPLLDALKRWQRDTGQQQTGTLAVGRLVVLPGAVRVGAVKAQLGDAAAEEMMSVTSRRKSVSVTVDAGDADLIRQGDEVSITLPDTREVPGKVASVSTTVQGGAGDESDPSGENTPPSSQVTVVPVDSAAVKGLDAASVRVTFTTQTRENVLTVPVGALLALQEGGYALQRPDGRLIPVKTGLFTKGQVEVSGAGVEEGERVVTAS
ncbi:hypothetical protein [Streptomyces sp. E5N91]|uniref:hypothetical protein n=1 Tax=Streptomyces sp. E5N91 TaxID=1851996 RepID=UPI000EF58D99|nr:hypothetical protein [Streptomyces sp. E5N91]